LKIALETVKNIAILRVTEAVTIRDVEILRAGLVKILKTGKNKIILELPANDSLPSEVIRELASFDIMARELAGRLVLAGVTTGLKTKIEVFALPPVILTFESREKAIEFFSLPPPSSSDEEPASLKARLHDLEQENKSLREQIILTTIARRAPTDEPGYREKIVQLEAKIEKLLTEAPPAVPATPGA
jgi:anti-anti-sigma regulatory factor